jgi:hypothetical protein
LHIAFDFLPAINHYKYLSGYGRVGRSMTPGAASKVSSLVSWLWAPAKLQKHMTKNMFSLPPGNPGVFRGSLVFLPHDLGVAFCQNDNIITKIMFMRHGQ